jgi:hypothetical protein
MVLGQRVSEFRADEAGEIADQCYGSSFKEMGSGADDLLYRRVQFRGTQAPRDPQQLAASKSTCVRAAVKNFLAPLDHPDSNIWRKLFARSCDFTIDPYYVLASL